jgi:hypothetical protein
MQFGKTLQISDIGQEDVEKRWCAKENSSCPEAKNE